MTEFVIYFSIAVVAVCVATLVSIRKNWRGF